MKNKYRESTVQQRV